MSMNCELILFTPGSTCLRGCLCPPIYVQGLHQIDFAFDIPDPSSFLLIVFLFTFAISAQYLIAHFYSKLISIFKVCNR